MRVRQLMPISLAEGTGLRAPGPALGPMKDQACPDEVPRPFSPEACAVDIPLARHSRRQKLEQWNRETRTYESMIPTMPHLANSRIDPRTVMHACAGRRE